MEWSFTNSITISQPSCKVVITLQSCEHLAQIATTLWRLYHKLTKLQQGCYNLVISVWDIIPQHAVFPKQPPITTPRSMNITVCTQTNFHVAQLLFHKMPLLSIKCAFGLAMVILGHCWVTYIVAEYPS